MTGIAVINDGAAGVTGDNLMGAAAEVLGSASVGNASYGDAGTPIADLIVPSHPDWTGRSAGVD